LFQLFLLQEAITTSEQEVGFRQVVEIDVVKRQHVAIAEVQHCVAAVLVEMFLAVAGSAGTILMPWPMMYRPWAVLAEIVLLLSVVMAMIGMTSSSFRLFGELAKRWPSCCNNGRCRGFDFVSFVSIVSAPAVGK
jgi:hypothetical protein